jgi:hypothetical protein
MGQPANFPCHFKAQVQTFPGQPGAKVLSLNQFAGIAHLAALVPGDVILAFNFFAAVGSSNLSVSVEVDQTTVGQLAAFSILDSDGGFFSLLIFSSASQQQITITRQIRFDFDAQNPDPASTQAGAWVTTI